ncbi:hypothetical protein LUZ61_020687 [Rhynchospora tenuis]|uniref:F-box domain-containing protein n=1 Tax=Rhynchospora tenuis TaxID=198213 RepID=A0AAD5ZDJ7_9POAL|nr:hypothetical protein LUZ61_020687 [Rhynchospora tenuis]
MTDEQVSCFVSASTEVSDFKVLSLTRFQGSTDPATPYPSPYSVFVNLDHSPPSAASMTTCTQPVQRNAGEEPVPYKEPDRLSDLPDALRLKILSSLDAKELVQTCILSKRWRNLWASVTYLHFDYAAFSSQSSQESHKRFMKFVNSFLLSIDKATKLDMFHLTCCLGDGDFYSGIGIDIFPFACKWITLAVEHKIKKLQLELSNYDCLRVPDLLFVCDSLEELDLSLNVLDNKKFVEVRPEKVNLPKLKRLDLSFIFIDGDYMEKFVNGCPVLESLSAYFCEISTSGVFFGNLKRLSVICCGLYYLDIPHMIPGLEYLYLADVPIDCISSNEMHKLTEASIISLDVVEELKCDGDDIGSLASDEVPEFMSSSLMDVLEKVLQKPLIFAKLRRLTLGDCCMNCAFGFLSSLLEHTPKLETLILYHGTPLRGGGECCKVNGDHGQNSREKIEWFHCKCLKKVEIFCTTSDGVPELVERVKLSTLGLNEVLVVVSNR